MDVEKLREKLHKEVEDIAHNNTKVSSIDHYTREESENIIGYSWSRLSDIYFEEDETIRNVQDLKFALEFKDYIVRFEETEDEVFLVVKVTKSVKDRFIF